MRIDLFISIICLYFSPLVVSLPTINLRSFRLHRYNRIEHLPTSSANTSIPQIFNATDLSPTSSLLSHINYNVKDIPIGLELELRDPPIPKVYLDAFLTTALRRIAPEVHNQPSGLIPGDHYMYRELAVTNVGIAYTGGRWTWQVLSWTLEVSYSKS